MLKLIPIYREKEMYTYFYNENSEKLYKIQHRKQSYLSYILLYLLVLYGSGVVNQIYQQFQSVLLKYILVAVVLLSCYMISKLFYKQYYLQDSMKVIYISNEFLAICIKKGMKQLKVESISVIVIGMPMILIGFLLFLYKNNIQALVIGALGIIILIVYILSHPYKRYDYLKEFDRRNVEGE